MKKKSLKLKRYITKKIKDTYLAPLWATTCVGQCNHLLKKNVYKPSQKEQQRDGMILGYIIYDTSRPDTRVHDNSVVDGWAGAVMQKPLGIQKCDGRTDRHGKVESRVRN